MKKLGQLYFGRGGEMRNLVRRTMMVCALLLLAAMTGCGDDYDDTELRGSVDDLNGRLTKLETQVAQLNSDYVTVSGLVTTLQRRLYVESVVSDGKGGYRIAFSDGTTASVAGSDAVAAVPVVGISTGEDGVYYWTKTVGDKVDWLLDGEGKKIPVSGVTPVLGVDSEGYWTISYDGGKTSQRLLDGAGDPIVAQADSIFFKQATADEAYLYLTLNDGKDTQLTIPIAGGFSLTIADAGQTAEFVFGQTREFAVESVGVAKVVVNKPDEWKVLYAENLLTVTAPSAEHAACADLTGEVALVYFNDKGLSKAASIAVTVAELPIVEFTVPTDFAGGNVQRALYGDTKVAEICREYIRTADGVDQQMTVVYPVVEGKADLTKGIETETGGTVVWNSATNTCTYKAGAGTTPLTKFYVAEDGSLTLEAEGRIVTATVEPDLLRDVRGTSIEEYRIAKIGTQYWMAESLRAERFADGSAIPTDWDNAAGSYIYLYESPADWKSVYGTMYSGAAVKNEKGLAPEGWSVPSADDVALLRDYVGSTATGSKLKSTGGGWSKNPGTNITGFDAMPGQYYTPASSTDSFGTLIEIYFWTSTAGTDLGTDGLVYYRFYDGNTRLIFDPDSANFTYSIHALRFGHYVRCVRK